MAVLHYLVLQSLGIASCFLAYFGRGLFPNWLEAMARSDVLLSIRRGWECLFLCKCQVGVH
jgi:hypothetical protein